MKSKVEQFITGSDEIINAYHNTQDLNLKLQIITQYQKSLYRIVNDALELNAFDLVENIFQKSAFNDEMKTYIINNLLLDRLKLIQNSGRYRLMKKIRNYCRF